MTKYAHSKENEPPENWQPLQDHLRDVAELVEKCAAKFQSADWGGVVGFMAWGKHIN